jgi:hypothetical protein
MDCNDDSKNSDLPEAFNAASAGGKSMELKRLKEALSKAIIGQREVVDRLTSRMLAGPTEAGKTDATLKAMAKAGQKVTVVHAEDFKNGAMDLSAGRVFYIDEIHRKSEEEISDAIDAFMGRPNRKQRGEIAAQEFRDGAADKVFCMKPLRYKRGFYSLTF